MKLQNVELRSRTLYQYSSNQKFRIAKGQFNSANSRIYSAFLRVNFGLQVPSLC